MWSATRRAFARSGAPRRPTANECRRGHHAASRPSSSIRLPACLAATALMIDESSPPLSSTP